MKLKSHQRVTLIQMNTQNSKVTAISKLYWPSKFLSDGTKTTERKHLDINRPNYDQKVPMTEGAPISIPVQLKVRGSDSTDIDIHQLILVLGA